jgi:hypothetical protein
MFPIRAPLSPLHRAAPKPKIERKRRGPYKRWNAGMEGRCTLEKEARRLHRQGLGYLKIQRRLGVPRGTLHRWLAH